MEFYKSFVTVNTPDPITLDANLRVFDATLGGLPIHNLHRMKKATPWERGDIDAVQAFLDTTASSRTKLLARQRVDTWPIEVRALLLVLIDQLNILRNQAGLSTVTPAQAMQAIRVKVQQLS